MAQQNKMYSQRKANIPAYRGCSFHCYYCAFKSLIQRNKTCPKCASFEPHFHPEALDKKPPLTKNGEFITIGLSGDISFASIQEGELLAILDYCCEWQDRTFLLQSKNPAFFHNFVCPENVILGTTIESNRTEFPESDYWSYDHISAAPGMNKRFDAMYELTARKVITIEPILDFDPDIFLNAIISLKPEWVWIGYDSKPDKNRLPEPSLAKTQDLIFELQDSDIKVYEKNIRPAWWEDAKKNQQVH